MPDGEDIKSRITFIEKFNSVMSTIILNIDIFFYSIFVEIPLVIIMFLDMSSLFVISAFRI